MGWKIPVGTYLKFEKKKNTIIPYVNFNLIWFIFKKIHNLCELSVIEVNTRTISLFIK